MAKSYRRFIKINGVLQASPEFDKKSDADKWYDERKAERDKVKSGRKSANVPTFLEFTAQWVKQLTIDYQPPTWKGYEQNVRIHLLPYLKDYRMDEITRAKCREVLMQVVRNGHSFAQRKHVQTTLSKIFMAAMNHEPPIVESSPVHRLTFEGRRQTSTYKPAVLETDQEVADCMRAAKEISDLHFILVCLGLMTGLRKSEMIALKWSAIRPNGEELRISEVYRDAMRVITKSTKSGEGVYRDVPMPTALVRVLNAYKERLGAKNSEFILAHESGRHFDSKEIHKLFVEVREKIGRPDLTIHSMRHTYGRLFALKTGNIKVLQKIFGHSSEAMTNKYAELTPTQIRPFGEIMSIDLSDTKDTLDTNSTQRAARK